ncbi:hypothetical protein LWF01_10270 [Saxibacter everestensis]|uniref:Bacteriocin biosynthesis cyclodehydratase domain-containing protein n=1 Tax=Saxibacter everestensis TaxID=2909229 RepID=A0ABY8QQ04_9MICO|nr:hypothetical protein LWF01_10270 [Brevibacteriaceae bacterium ZFBP1038]
MLQLFPALRQAWRSSHCLQLGIQDPVLIDGLDGKDELLLVALRAGVSEAEYRRRTAELGVDPARADSLLRLLGEAQALVPAPENTAERVTNPYDSRLAHFSAVSLKYRETPSVISSRRSGKRVLLVGHPGFADQLKLALATGGITADLTDCLPERDPDVDLVVLIASDVADPALADELMRNDIPHLLVTTGETTLTVGPLVVPGTTACLRCSELQHCDEDAQWPIVFAQLCAGSRPPPDPDPLLVTAGAGLAALQCATFLDARRTASALSARLELALPDGDVSRLDITPHPRCGCQTMPTSSAASAWDAS